MVCPIVSLFLGDPFPVSSTNWFLYALVISPGSAGCHFPPCLAERRHLIVFALEAGCILCHSLCAAKAKGILGDKACMQHVLSSYSYGVLQACEGLA